MGSQRGVIDATQLLIHLRVEPAREFRENDLRLERSEARRMGMNEEGLVATSQPLLL